MVLVYGNTQENPVQGSAALVLKSKSKLGMHQTMAMGKSRASSTVLEMKETRQ